MAGRLPGEGAGMTSIGLLPDAADDEDCTGEFLTFVVPPSGRDLGCSFCLAPWRSRELTHLCSRERTHHRN
jgi:hypothetical protein